LMTLGRMRARRSAAHRRSRIPVLEASGAKRFGRFAFATGRLGHPALVFFISVVAGVLLLAACSMGLGFLLTHELSHAPGLGSANRHVDEWLAARRTPDRTEASLIGSIVAGGVVLPIVAGVFALGCLVRRRWRVAAFGVFALAVESGAYRVTTLVIHEHRPRVHRLEQLPVDASYPSGHTAASIAVYGGLVLLLTSKVENRVVRAVAWAVAAAIPVYVGLSRMYRGMHYPLDVMGGALLGIGALCVVVFACQASGAAADRREQGGNR
ncbi:MAG TPA: phosphatase PAP2 family protein, partial [Gaiellaceae bacterium]|nr:phosphatase PAP2 family protein [Gaiellaceae bacterium]